MIGVGDALGGAIALVLWLSVFSLIVIPSLSVMGFAKMRFMTQQHGCKRIVILAFLYVLVLLIGHSITVFLLPWGFTYSFIWEGFLLAFVIGFNWVRNLKANE